MTKSTFYSEEKIINRLCSILNLKAEQYGFTFKIYDENKTFLFEGGAPIVLADLRNMVIDRKETDLIFNIESKIDAVNKINHFLIEARDLVTNYLSTTNYKIKNDGELFAKDEKEIGEILETLKSSNNVFNYYVKISYNALQVSAKINYKKSSDDWGMYDDWVTIYDLKDNHPINNKNDQFENLVFDDVYNAIKQLPTLEKQAQELKHKISKLKYLTVGI